MRIDYCEKIQTIRQQWGEKLLILGHYYIPDDTLSCTDRQGDSLALAQIAAQSEACEAIVFCGVRFMAETADILVNSPEKIAKRGGKRVPVILVDKKSGCPMANMVTRPLAEACYKRLSIVFGELEYVIPITYINSTADVKAFCGGMGGAVCTSSNARRVLEWALNPPKTKRNMQGVDPHHRAEMLENAAWEYLRKRRVLFLPDQHLGRNTARAMGIPEEEIVLWKRNGSTSSDDLRRAKIILWDGYCPIHAEMTPELVQKARAEHPDAALMVHPECCHEVVSQSVAAGSTKFLIDQVKAMKPGDSVILGTESHLVERLKTQNSDREIFHLGEPHPCKDMGQNTLEMLYIVLKELNAGRFRNITVVQVPEEIAEDARVALVKMLELG